MAYGRRYKAKLHVLEEDDLASILTPAPPCKVPGLGTKGRNERRKMRRERAFFFFFARSLFFFFFLRLSLLAKAFGAECEYFSCSALQSSRGIDTRQAIVRLWQSGFGC